MDYHRDLTPDEARWLALTLWPQKDGVSPLRTHVAYVNGDYYVSHDFRTEFPGSVMQSCDGFIEAFKLQGVEVCGECLDARDADYHGPCRNPWCNRGTDEVTHKHTPIGYRLIPVNPED
jgi:hypothetical protein